jgi:hypothetical protein
MTNANITRTSARVSRASRTTEIARVESGAPVVAVAPSQAGLEGGPTS